MTSEDSVSYETIHRGKDKFALLTLKPADSHHLFSQELIGEFRDLLRRAVSDNVRGLITTHDGHWFSGGLDYKSAPEAKLVEEFAKLIADLIQLPFPTAAFVSGRAYGAGFTLALAHDYLVLSNDTPVSLRQDELATGHELPPYAVALVRDKFDWLASFALLIECVFVTPPRFAPISDYVLNYVGWTIDQVVDNLLKQLADRAGDNYSNVRKILLPGASDKVKPTPTRG